LLKFANSIGIGGVAITLAKMACVGDLAGEFSYECDDRRDIFDESFSRAIVGTSDRAAFESVLKSANLPFQFIGTTARGDAFSLNDIKASLKEMKELYFGEFERLVKAL